MLAPAGCRLHWYSEAEVAQCLGGKALLHMGSAAAVDVQRGFAQLNSTLAAWTRVRPGPQHPNTADFWRAFLKEGGSFCYQRRRCAIRFGASEVSMRYPTLRGGLEKLLRSDAGTAALQHRMCAADIVIFEAGLDDFNLVGGLPAGRSNATGAGKRRRQMKDKKPLGPTLVAACEGKPATECDAALAAAGGVRFDTSASPLAEYLGHLRQLLKLWGACRLQRGPAWRAIFKLAAVPPRREPPADARDCSWLKGGYGYASLPHLIRKISQATRAEVEAAGFEVFAGALGATLHAPPQWFDTSSGIKGRLRQVQGAVDPSASEALSDLVTQLLVTQLCGKKISGERPVLPPYHSACHSAVICPQKIATSSTEKNALPAAPGRLAAVSAAPHQGPPPIFALQGARQEHTIRGG